MSRDPFDSENIPDAVMKPESVRWVNDLIARLSSRQLKQLIIQDQETKFRVPGMIVAYGQSCLHRCLNLINASGRLLKSDDGPSAIILARSAIETVAAFVWFKKKIIQLIDEGDVVKIHDFVHATSFSTKLEHLIEKSGGEAKATNILTQIDGLKSLRAEARTEYDHLCEITHPNSLGTFLLFAKHDRKADVVEFFTGDQFPDESFKWTVVAAQFARFLEDALDEIDKKLPALRKIEVAYRAKKTTPETNP